MILNTLSNYGTLVLKLIITIFLTRILFMGLSRPDYGFWALLWSIFGYSLLLDFGFGVSVQKYTSEVYVNQDWDKYNQLISTVFFNYCMMSLVIILGTVGLSFFLDKLFSFPPGTDIKYYRDAFLIFGIGTAFVFPFGFFPEVLRGMQWITLRNWINLGWTVINFVIIAAVVLLGLKLREMAIVTVVGNLLSSLTMGYVCFKKIPRFRIRWKYYNRALLKSVMGFSMYAYIIMFSNLVIFRTDQVVISVMGTMALVGIYQIASRLAETYRQFAVQFNDNLGPVAATLFTAGNKEKLAGILVQSNRLIGFVSTLMLIPLLVYVKPLLQIWLKLTDADGIQSAILLLVSMYILVMFRSTTVQILLMSNEHKSLTRVAVIECIANLILSVLLIRRIGIIGVAIGTLIPNLFFAFAYNIPAACKFAHLKQWDFIKESLLKTLWIGTLTLILAIGLYAWHYPGNLYLLAIYSIIVCVFYLVMYYFFGVHGWERKQFNDFVSSKLKRKTA